MGKIILENQNLTGSFPEHRGKINGVQHGRIRLTIPAREVIESAGGRAEMEAEDASLCGVRTYTVTLARMLPPGLLPVATRIAPERGHGYHEITSLRLAVEPEYPGECEAGYWARLDWTPCPTCGAPLVWYEAGYVPGYRVCAGKKHHHWLASRLA